MNLRPAAALILLTATVAFSAPPSPQAPEAVAPLLFVSIQGPENTAVTILETAKARKSLDTPVSIGLRPGYVYRFRFDGLALRNTRKDPNAKPEPIYASLEVGGTLRLPPKLKAADYAAPMVLSESDIENVFADRVVTKVLLLEDPDKADAKRGPGDKVVELDLTADENPFEFAKSLGRPLAILRIGRREPDADQLNRQKTGNILYPGETALPPVARDPSCFLVDMRPYFRQPEECIRDGGDLGKPVHHGSGGQIEGLDPADTIAEYVTSQGGKRIAITNRVCICVPRFLAVRIATPLAGYDGVNEPARAKCLEIAEKMDGKQGLRDNRKIEDPELLRGRTNLKANVGVVGMARIIDLQELRGVHMDLGPAEYLCTDTIKTLDEKQKLQLKRCVDFALQMSGGVGIKGLDGSKVGPVAIGMMEGLGQVQGRVETKSVVYICKEGEKPEVPDQPLQVLKWASTDAAKIGDVVTFHIRYSNTGGKPISNIAISDSLTARLEYIPGSAQSDREAIFITQTNEADSLLLKWEIKDPLPPCSRGVVKFQARIK